MSYEPTVWVDGDHVTSAKLNKLEQGVNSMSYTPTVWNAGDVVTAEKLNKLEQGVAEGGGGGDYPTFTYTPPASLEPAKWSCDKTFEECGELSTTYGIDNKYYAYIVNEGANFFVGSVYSEGDVLEMGLPGGDILIYLSDGSIFIDQ